MTPTFSEQFQQALRLVLPEGTSDLSPNLSIERPRDRQFGHYAVNVAPLAKVLRQAPPAIAAQLAEQLQAQPEFQKTFELTVVGAFLNVRVTPAAMAQALENLSKQTGPLGQNTALADQRILLEYVSANPTGPLHIGHGRWAAMGDSLARLLKASGAQVWQEFYVNDAGSQIDKILTATWLRLLQCCDESRYQAAGGDEVLPYPGDYVLELAQALLAEHPNWRTQLPDTLTEEFKTQLRPLVVPRLMAEQADLLKNFGVVFDLWFSEQSLYNTQPNPIDNVLNTLAQRHVTYTQEGALWLKTESLGDEKDRVLQKADGSYTYLTPDIAYHHHKYTSNQRQGAPFTHLVNIWGADHHGYIARMKAAMTALGHNADTLEIVLGQLVNLVVSGERTRMGKRRKMLTLQDVLDEVGVDATRFWMVSRSADTTLDFDVDLAASASQDNPVFYAQYGHARACGIMRQACQTSTNGEVETPAEFTPQELEAALHAATADTMLPFLSEHSKDSPALQELIVLIDSFPTVVSDAARRRSPYLVARYVLTLAAEFHNVYSHCRMLTGNPQQSLPRLLLVQIFQKTMASALQLLGVQAPERMN